MAEELRYGERRGKRNVGRREEEERKEGSEEEGRGCEGNRGEGKRDGRGGKRRGETRAPESVHNLRKTIDPRHQMAGYGHVCAPNF